MVIDYELYQNDGWGLSKIGFEKLYNLIKNDERKNIRVLEFGSGISTKFFSDLSNILEKNIFVTSFDDSEEFMYHGTSNPNIVVKLRALEETTDNYFEKMFVDMSYNKKYMTPKTSSHFRNMFYSLEPNDIDGLYDYVLLDGPHGNGRSLAYLHILGHLSNEAIIFIDDYTHYDFVDKLLSIYNCNELYRHTAGNQNKWHNGGDFIIFKQKNIKMKNFEVIDFRFAMSSDFYNKKYCQDGAWSRPYEYPYVVDFIKNNTNVNKIKIHNSSWGFEGIHVDFRDELDLIGECIHSDIVHSEHRSTFYYDITTENKEFENSFDFVINVSTIEHLKTANDRITSIENLFKQVKPGGYLILTFDYPRVSLFEIEGLINKKCDKDGIILNGENSINPNLNYKDLNIVYLILKKNE